MLSACQKQIVEAHYGVPVPLLTLLDGSREIRERWAAERSGSPPSPRHNINAAIMWFALSAFAEACVRLQISSEFWLFYMRAILCGLLNDGLYRRRFTVQGFQAMPEGGWQSSSTPKLWPMPTCQESCCGGA
jgi:hypothetical protein